MWVAMHLLSLIWITCILFLIFIQAVSGCAPLELDFYNWYSVFKFYPACKWLRTFWAQFELIFYFYFLSSLWLAVHLLSLIWTTDILFLISIQSVSGCAPPEFDLNSWYSEILSRMWVFSFLFLRLKFQTNLLLQTIV